MRQPEKDDARKRDPVAQQISNPVGVCRKTGLATLRGLSFGSPEKMADVIIEALSSVD